MTGTAEIVAEEVQAALEDLNLSVDVTPMDSLDATALDDPEPAYLICTSTYGQGDVPDNARDFFEALESGKPDLGSIRYGVVGLGDSTYADTYNQGCRKFDALLTELGAKRIGDRMEHNASSDDLPEDVAVEWARQWVELLAKHSEAA
jgi:MioC protein